ncbi:MAG: hypothetical protein IPM35_10175 [Myxococcales bacterium]|nr:hypothetical protein [Myxococcales bacterium]
MLAGGGQFFSTTRLREARANAGRGAARARRAVFVGADPALVSDAAAAVVVHRDGAGVLRVRTSWSCRPARSRPR